MIIVSDSSNNVIDSFPEGTTITDLPNVAQLPAPTTIAGKNAQLVIDPQTQVLSYIYTDRPLTTDEQISALQTVSSSFTAQITSLQASSAFINSINQQVGDFGLALMNALMAIAMLQTQGGN
jgi:hypothetical protein